MSLSSVLSPRSIAIVGASSRSSSLAFRLLKNLERIGYDGDVHLVSPRHENIDGRPCVDSVRDIPAAVDVAVLAVPSHVVVDQIAELGATGVRHAVVYGSGFAELDLAGARLQGALVDAAVAHGVSVVGPNCMGNLNLVDRACTTFSSTAADEPIRPGPVACVTQSGGVGVALYSMGVRSGLGFSHIISTGNEALVSAADFLEVLADDVATEVVLVYAEQLRAGRRFLAAAHDLIESGRQVIVLQSGRTHAGATAVRSHTGALATSWAVTRDVLAEAGIVTVETPQELVIAAQLATAYRPMPTGRRLTALTSSGGTAVLTADLGDEAGLAVPELDEVTAKQLTSLLPPYAPVGNPLDLPASYFHNAQAASRLLEALDTASTDALAVVSIGATDSSVRLAETLAPLLAACPTPAMVAWIGGDERTRAPFVECAIPYDDDPKRLLATFGRLVGCADRRGRTERPQADPRRAVTPDRTRSATEDEVKQWLAAANLSVPRSIVATSPAEAAAFADELAGPIALKLLDPAIPHRGRVGALALSLRTQPEIATAWERICAAARPYGAAPDAPMLAEEMVIGTGEWLLGYQRDTAVGPVVAFGVGGWLAEQLGNVAFALAPTSVERAAWLIDQAAPRALLGDIGRAQMSKLVTAISQWCSDGDDIVSLDLNPIVQTGRGLVILDALADVNAEVNTNVPLFSES